MPSITEPVNILECTIRDGNYAVDFSFTAQDTREVVYQLARLGFEWIEIGHGLGLGASRAGKGDMPDGDIRVIEEAVSVKQAAKVGAFFIPGIGTKDDLRQASEAGLDFIRIGYNASEIEEAYEYISYSRSLGMIPCLNLMKTYAIPSMRFAEIAQQAQQEGAEIVYCVDSAGCMMPEEVAEYCRAAREHSDCDIGFHGHNNLMLAVTNCLSALQAGATFVDTTIYGLGRSAGNAQTEVLLSLLAKQGVPTGIDVFEFMNVAEGMFAALVGAHSFHSMLGVAVGLGAFHTSFLPEVTSEADKVNADVRRILVEEGRFNPSDLDRVHLLETCQRLKNTQPKELDSTILKIQSMKMQRETSLSEFSSAEELFQAIQVSSSKRIGTRKVLVLSAIDQPEKDFFTSRLLIDSDAEIVAKIVLGDLEQLEDVVQTACLKDFIVLLDVSSGFFAGKEQALEPLLSAPQVLSFSEREETTRYYADLFSQRPEHENILVFGGGAVVGEALQQASLRCQVVAYLGSDSSEQSSLEKVSLLSSFQDWQHLEMEFDAVFCFSGPRSSEIERILKNLAKHGTIYTTLFGQAAWKSQTDSRPIKSIHPERCYAGLTSRLLAASLDSL